MENQKNKRYYYGLPARNPREVAILKTEDDKLQHPELLNEEMFGEKHKKAFVEFIRTVVYSIITVLFCGLIYWLWLQQ